MNSVVLGILCGLAFGIIDILIMLPIKFENRRKKYEALMGAFIDRFMIGFLIPNVQMGIHPMIVGVILGSGLSLPSAIITRAYAPVIGIGVVGGIITGVITNIFIQ